MRILISHLVAKLENHTSADISWVLNEYYSSPQYKWCHLMAQLAMYASPFLKNGPFKVQTGIAQKAFDPPPVKRAQWPLFWTLFSPWMP